MFLEYQQAVISWYKSCKCSISLFFRQQKEQFLHTDMLQMSETMPTLPKNTPRSYLTHDILCGFLLFCLFILVQTRPELITILLYLLFYPPKADRHKKPLGGNCHLSVKIICMFL